jgi:hypothetical protein
MVRIEGTVADSTVSERREAFPHRDVGISTKEPSLPGQHCEAPAKTVEMEFDGGRSLGFETCMSLSVELNATSLNSGLESTVCGSPRVH